MTITSMISTQRGFSLIELNIALVLAGLALAGGLSVVSSVQRSGDNRQVAADLIQVGRAAEHYISQRRTELLATDVPDIDDIFEVSVADLKTAGSLPNGFTATNLFGQTYRIFIKRADDDPGGPNDGATAGDRLLGLVTTSGGTALSDKQGAEITTAIGAAGGFIYSDSTTTIEGNMGNWSFAKGDWITASPPGAGQLAISTAMLALVGPAGAGAGAEVIDDLSDAITDYTDHNMFVGDGSGSNYTSGTHNTAYGINAMENVDGSDNVVLGAYAFLNGRGNSNTGIGAATLGLVGGTNADSHNTAVGNETMSQADQVERNTAIGAFALLGAGSGGAESTDNVAIGDQAASNTTSIGSRNTLIGRQAGRSLGNATAPNDNVVIGDSAQRVGSYMGQSVLIGHSILFSADPANTTNNRNVVIGHRAFSTAVTPTTFADNVIISNSGASCAFSAGANVINNVILGSCGTLGAVSNRVSIGNSLISNTSIKLSDGAHSVLGIAIGEGSYAGTGTDISVGNNAGSATAGAGNAIAIGRQALEQSVADNTVAIGQHAGVCSSNGGANSHNVFVGNYAANGGAACNRDFNTIVGNHAAKGLTTGQSNIILGAAAINTIIGQDAGVVSGLTTGSNNIVINRGNVVLAAGESNYLQISPAIRGNTSTRYVVLGGAGTETVGGTLGGMSLYVPDGGIQAVGYYYVSDRSLKQDIAPLILTADALASLHPVAYTHKNIKGRKLGFIAQDVQDYFPEAVVHNGPHLGLDYGSMMAPLTVQIQHTAKATVEAEAALFSSSQSLSLIEGWLAEEVAP